MESAAKKNCKLLITTKPTKGTRKNTSEDNEKMKNTELKGECDKYKTAFSMWYTNADTNSTSYLNNGTESSMLNHHHPLLQLLNSSQRLIYNSMYIL